MTASWSLMLKEFTLMPGQELRIDLMGRRCLYSVSGNLEEGGVKFTINFLSVCRE